MGKIPAVNLGERLTRISRAHIEAMFAPLPVVPTAPEKQPVKMDYSQEECYTIVEVSRKYGVSHSTVRSTIRRNSIPQKTVGNYVYVPKIEIDKIFLNK